MKQNLTKSQKTEQLKIMRQQIIDLQKQCQALSENIAIALRNISNKVDAKKIIKLKEQIDVM